MIALHGIGRYYKTDGAGVGALVDITMNIHAGEFVAIMGPSGSGKTTLMNILGCLDRPTGGEYVFAGLPIHDADAEERARLRREVFGLVFQNYNLLTLATARENVEVPAIYAGANKRRRRARAARLLSELGLRERMDHRPGELSGGEQQRVAIARALMNGGRVLLADEPTGSLDSRSGREVMGRLASLANGGHTVIVVTHDPGVAAYAKRTIELLDGRVVADSGSGTDRDLRTRQMPADSQKVQPGEGGVRTLLQSFRESASTAFRVLQGNGLRTALTLLGIVIGIVSVTVMMGAAEGARRAILAAVQELGSPQLVVMPVSHVDPDGRRPPPLTIEDAVAISRQVPHVVSAVPEIDTTFFVQGTALSLVGTTVQGLREAELQLVNGVFFTDQEDANHDAVVLLDGREAEELFGNADNALGKYLSLNGANHQVIGVLKRGERKRWGFGEDESYVPYRTSDVRLEKHFATSRINVRYSNARHLDSVRDGVSQVLTQQRGAADFTIQDFAEWIAATQRIASVTTWLFGAIGGVSLVVAGVGVMNIMLASVAERTREIGLRMATGARQRDIMLQFVCESIVVTGIGGIGGLIVAGAVGRLLIALAPNMPQELFFADPESLVVFTPGILLTGLSAAMLTGLIFGFAPARRAARMDPVVALAAH